MHTAANAKMIAFYGRVLIQLERYNEAEKHLLNAIELDTSIHLAYKDLGFIYYTRKDKKKADEFLSKYYRTVPPNSEEAKFVLERLQELREN